MRYDFVSNQQARSAAMRNPIERTHLVASIKTGLDEVSRPTNAIVVAQGASQ
jgi:hypothetical protein